MEISTLMRHNSTLDIESFDDWNDTQAYAEKLYRDSSRGLCVKFFAIASNSPSSYDFGYSIGLITKRYNALSICIFKYADGSLYTNGILNNGEWIGWRHIVPQ